MSAYLEGRLGRGVKRHDGVECRSRFYKEKRPPKQSCFNRLWYDGRGSLYVCVPSGRYAHAFCIYPHSSPYERRDAVQLGVPIRGSPLVQIAPCREEPLLPLSRVRRTRSVVRMPSLHPRLTHGVEKSWRTYRRPQVGYGVRHLSSREW
jgi:hypothetical protein